MPVIESIGVIGAGTMGSGIAPVCARAGAGCGAVRRVAGGGGAGAGFDCGEPYAREVAKAKLTAQQADEARARIRSVTAVDKLFACPLIIEAATEKFAVKADLFRELDRGAAAETILASNTSSISITKLAAVTERPARVIGMHFFNPVPVMKLVEIIRGLATSQATFDTVKTLSERLGKLPIEVNDSPGFISNRVLMPLINEACYAVMEGVATAEAIDAIFREGMAHPMGPLTLADFIGLDVCVDIMRVMAEGLGSPRYNPCPLLVRMVDAGWLGKKSGRGFYSYGLP